MWIQIINIFFIILHIYYIIKYKKYTGSLTDTFWSNSFDKLIASFISSTVMEGLLLFFEYIDASSNVFDINSKININI